MGSSGSKSSSSSPAAASMSCSERVRRRRSKGHRVFQSSCLGTSSGSHPSDNDDNDCESENKKNEHDYLPANQTAEAVDQKKIDLDGWDQAVTAPRTESTSVQSMNPSSSILSRFSFIPGNVSFRLSRATSLGSSRSYPVSSTNLSMLNDEDELDLQIRPTRDLGVREETRQANGTSSQCYGDSPANFRLNAQASGVPDVLQENQTVSSTHDVASDCDNARVEPDANFSYPRILSDNESSEIRQSDRRTGSREPVERNVRFSRTLSVGRLRDRVLRRSTLSDNLTVCPQQEERDVGNAETRALSSDDNAITSPTPSGFPPSLSSSLFNTQDYEMEPTRPREARYHDLLEHRSNFLERRRRIRSQVRALQRLGNRFENLSGHERSCILSGQHRTGHCTCRINNRDTSLNDNTSARASISRIVMLAEALFEVLDEIHQQSVVLSTHSASSIGSIPAPNDVVDSLPVKFYSKLRKHQTEEVAQCYICLVEYEEGDSMRVLPCHHEFHAACVDKWLKEIHRVCPLCRGDICRSDALSEVK